MSSVTDDMFAAYAEQAEKEAQERASRKGSGGSSASYEEIQWCGLPQNAMKIIRALGPPPDTSVDEFTAKTVRISWIVGDDGRKFRCILPEAAEDPNNVIWRVINRVKAVDWDDNKKRFYPMEKSNKPIFDIVAHNGHPEGSPQYKYDKGWVGQQRLIMNVIDRERMDWHLENKHSMLLSRNIGQGKDGTLFPEEGVPSYGFASLLATLFRYYKSWEKYDIGILRTGQMETPYRVINAGKYIEEVPVHLQEYIVQEPLTDEEASWDRYDLNKLFGVTKYTKIHNRLKITLARIDASLGTSFLKEIEHYVEEEKKLAEEQKETTSVTVEADIPKSTPTPSVATEEKQAPTRTRKPVGVVQAEEADNGDPPFAQYLKGWPKLTDAEKAMIKDVVVKDGKVVDIKYTDPDAVLLACPECGMPAPDSFVTCCPVCGLDF